MTRIVFAALFAVCLGGPSFAANEIDGVTIEKKVKKKKLAKLMIGEWGIVLPDEVRAKLAVMELALQEGSSVDDVQGMGLPDDQLEAAKMVFNGLSNAPDAVKKKARAQIKAVMEARVVIDEDSMDIKSTKGDNAAKYSIVSTEDNRLELQLDHGNGPGPAQFLFVNKDRAVLIEGPQRQIILVR